MKNRLKEHNNGESRYSKTKLPFSLIWFCAFPNKNKALKFEKYLKHGSGHAFSKRHLV
ncbi:MAG: GIY-YIG nuclease family protein [Minisyncoccia bacterium]